MTDYKEMEPSNSSMNEPLRSPEWVRTDQWVDVASSLGQLSVSLQLALEQPQNWKWAVLACHSALQGVLVCVLSGSDGIACLTDRSMNAVREWIEASRADADARHPTEYVAEMPVLIRRACDVNYMNEFGGAPVTLDAQAGKDLKLLHQLRNRFTHFRPGTWSIEVSGLPRIVHTSIRIAQRIMLSHPACTVRFSEYQTQLFSEQFQQVSEALETFGTPSLPILIPEPEHLVAR